jgi:hypothetical protein
VTLNKFPGGSRGPSSATRWCAPARRRRATPSARAPRP